MSLYNIPVAPIGHRTSDTFHSLIAGSVAGGIEIAITYPIEFAKTRLQLNQDTGRNKQNVPWPKFGLQWYSGCMPFLIGNSVKTSIRFVCFEFYQKLLTDSNGNISRSRILVAGFGAGATESLLAVTPTELIKTVIIEDRRLEKPRIQNSIHAISIIAREHGLRGFFQGFWPTTARQSAGSAIRLGSYTFLKQVVQSRTPQNKRIGTVDTFIIGSLAGLITVYLTQPLDTIKTCMQGLQARTRYRNSFTCAKNILEQEGVLALWRGAVARSTRLVMSGGIVFMVYEKVMEGLDVISPVREL
ncbi:probable fumonisin cluster-tricarboxylate transporter [Fusarium fujikuroi]|nr:probable fumonisin cluster-tricarboxylate transporter [Fusarium fujikuroi]